MSLLVDTFLDLVQIDSPSGNETQVTDYIQKFLAPLGFTFQVDEVGNLLAKRKGVGEPTLFCAHMDTVQPGVGIKPSITDGIIVSAGDTILGADNKASLAAILSAVANIDLKESPSLELLFTVKEEVGGGVEYFPFEWLKSKQGYIFDYAAPLGKIISAAPFIVNFSVEFIGKAAHTKNPEKGKSALIPLAEFLTQYSNEKHMETAVNFGQVQGGSGANIIPDKSSILGEVRTFSELIFKQELKTLETTAKKIADKYRVKCLWKIDGYCAGYELDQKSFALKRAKAVLKESGLESNIEISKGVSDANVLCQAGIDVVVLSDGTQNPHCLNECIKVADLEKLQQIVSKLMEKN